MNVNVSDILVQVNRDSHGQSYSSSFRQPFCRPMERAGCHASALLLYAETCSVSRQNDQDMLPQTTRKHGTGQWATALDHDKPGYVPISNVLLFLPFGCTYDVNSPSAMAK